MSRCLRAGLAVLALVLTTAACGDDDDADDAAPTTEADAGSDDDAAGDDAGATGDITIEGFSFEPASLEVTAGESITVANADGVTHTITAGTPEETLDSFDESLDGGATTELTLDEPGTHEYFCAIHTEMTGEIVVS